MTKYWVDIEGCQRLINEMNAVMDTKSDDFQHVPSAMDEVERTSFFGMESATRQESDASKLDAAYTGFFDDKLVATFDDVVLQMQTAIDSMQAAVNYYTSGDAAMAYDSQDQTSDFPEYRSASGSSTADYPEPSGTVEQPLPPVRPTVDEGLSEGYYTPSPYSKAHEAETYANEN